MSGPYYSDESTVLWHGDCVAVMRGMDDNSVHAVVTDPPYNLSDSGKRDSDCLSRILADIRFPDADDRNAESVKGSDLASPGSGIAPLHREHGSVRVGAGVGVPERAVDLQGSTVMQQEVYDPDVAAQRSSDGDLAGIADGETVEYLGYYVLDLAGRGDTSFCDGTCSCFTEPSAGVLAMTIRAVPTAGCPDPFVDLGSHGRGDTNICIDDDAASQAEGSPLVMTGTGAVHTLMLRLDLSGRTGELRSASGTRATHLAASLRNSELIGAGTGASGLPAVLEPYSIRLVGDGTDRTLTLHIPSRVRHVFQSSAAGGFMGKQWDGWRSPAAFQRWCTAWAVEALRVLRPGGHLLAFGGTRTFHRLACAIEDAGFEIRDSITWIYGSGFPKSLDVGKAIDKRPGVTRHAEFVAHLTERRGTAGLSRADVSERVVGTRSGACWNWEHHQFPEAKWWPALRDLLDMNEDEWGPVIAEAERARTGTHINGLHRGTAGVGAGGVAQDKRDTPATDAARTWNGWGTALKPAHEPIVVARKPLTGTVASNVTRWGTGAINIDATRVATSDDYGSRYANGPGGSTFGGNEMKLSEWQQPDAGRWPSNIVISHSPSCTDRCVDGCPVRELDQQSGVSTAGQPRPERGTGGIWSPSSGLPVGPQYGDTGGSSRFFPTFRYEAKAPTLERPSYAKEDGSGIAHATVKPLDLMRFLVRLVTPPDGVVLDMFAGSGTTLEAAMLEGFNSVGIEQDVDYLPLIAERIRRGKARGHQGDLFGGAA